MVPPSVDAEAEVAAEEEEHRHAAEPAPAVAVAPGLVVAPSQGSLASPSLKKPNASERRPSARTWPSCRRIRMGTDFNLPPPRSLLASLVLKSDNAFYGVFFTWDLAQAPLPSIQWLLDACFLKDLALARSTCLTRLGKDRAEPMETSVRKGGRNCV